MNMDVIISDSHFKGLVNVSYPLPGRLGNEERIGK